MAASNSNICGECVTTSPRTQQPGVQIPIIPPPQPFSCKYQPLPPIRSESKLESSGLEDSELIPPPAEFNGEERSGISDDDVIPPPPQYFLGGKEGGGAKISVINKGSILANESASVTTSYNGSRQTSSTTYKTSAVVTDQRGTREEMTSSNCVSTSESRAKSEEIRRESSSIDKLSPDGESWQATSENHLSAGQCSMTSAGSSSSWTDTFSDGSRDTTEDLTSSVCVRKCSSEEVVSKSVSQSLCSSSCENMSRFSNKRQQNRRKDIRNKVTRSSVEGETKIQSILDNDYEDDDTVTENGNIGVKRKHVDRFFKLNVSPTSENCTNDEIATSLAVDSTPLSSSPVYAKLNSPEEGSQSTPIKNLPSNSNRPTTSPTGIEHKSRSPTNSNLTPGSTNVKIVFVDRCARKKEMEGKATGENDRQGEKCRSNSRDKFFQGFGAAYRPDEIIDNEEEEISKKLAECSNLDRECDRLLMQECVQTGDETGEKVKMRTTISSSETKPHYRRSQIETSQEICRQLFPKDRHHEFFFGKESISSEGRATSKSGPSLFAEFLDQKRSALTSRESTTARYDVIESKTASSKRDEPQRPRSLSGGFSMYSDKEGDGSNKAGLVLYPIEVQVVNNPKKTSGSVPVTPVSSTTDDSMKQSERKEEIVTVERPLTFILPDGSSSSRRRSQDQSGASLMRPYDPDISGISSTISERGCTNTSAPVSPVLRTRPGSAATPKRAPLATADSSSISSYHSRQSSIDSRFNVISTSTTTGLGLTSSSSTTQPHFVVVAIDFGTTYSGYAFSFTRDPDSIHMMRRWEGGDPGVVNQKTPTTLLLQPDGKFHSFGFTARDFYHDLDFQEARKWLYFEKFKMTLHHNADLSKDTILKAANGKPYSALSVFSHALKFFKDHALQELSDQSSTTIINEDIRWVITVPAIWKAPAKQFMRQAAYQAGIASPEARGQLLIALEPEAASIYVRKLRLYQLVPDPGERGGPSPSLSNRSAHREQTPDFFTTGSEDMSPEDSISSACSAKYRTLPTGHYSSPPSLFPVSTTTTVGHEVDKEGTRYMVVDCGGGTVDITVYEMESKYGALKELHKATGGPYGSLGVDLEFEKLLIAIFGTEFIEAFKQKRPAGWVDLMTAFESRKRTASPRKNNSLNVSLPFSFIDYYKKCKSGHVEVAIRRFGSKDVCWSSQGMLRLTTEAMRRLFQPTLDRIKQSIGDVLNSPSARDIKYMFLVGGFSESPILQMEMRKEFNHLLKIVIPQDVGLTILKGAVCFGLDPTVVCERRSRLTYGVGVLNRFVPDRHPQSKLVHKQGIDWCTDVYDRYVEVDQSVALGDTVIRSYTPAKVGQKSSIIHIFCSDRPGVEYITDPGVRRCGTLCLDLTDVQYRQPPGGSSALASRGRREIHTMMTFGDTEIKVTALDVATGKSVRAEIDFLNK